jgi:hypothetical protein
MQVFVVVSFIISIYIHLPRSQRRIRDFCLTAWLAIWFLLLNTRFRMIQLDAVSFAWLLQLIISVRCVQYCGLLFHYKSDVPSNSGSTSLEEGHAVAYFVEALCYKPEGRGFESRWGGFFFFNWPNPSSRTMALGWTLPLTEMSTRNLPGGKGWLARKADSLTAICEPVV